MGAGGRLSGMLRAQKSSSIMAAIWAMIACRAGAGWGVHRKKTTNSPEFMDNSHEKYGQRNKRGILLGKGEGEGEGAKKCSGQEYANMQRKNPLIT